jgi:hypothetical protein
MKPFTMTTETGAQTYSPLRDIQTIAEGLGLECIESDERLLQLDLDSPEAVEAHGVLLEMFKRYFPKTLSGKSVAIVGQMTTTSKSGGTHVYLTLAQPLSERERIELQSLLGSDRKREILNLVRVDRLGDGVITLFETPEEAYRVRSFLGRVKLLTAAPATEIPV